MVPFTLMPWFQNSKVSTKIYKKYHSNYKTSINLKQSKNAFCLTTYYNYNKNDEILRV